MEETTNSDKLKELHDQIKKMEQENRELFEQLGLSPHQVEDILSDPKRYSKESYDYIQRQRQRLANALQERIDKVNAPIKREKASTDPAIKGHWIFIR